MLFRSQIEKLADIDPIMEKEIDAYLHTDEARALLMKPVAKWLKNVSYELEEYTMPICVKHNIPYSSLSLNSFLSMSDIQIDVGKFFDLPVTPLFRDRQSHILQDRSDHRLHRIVIKLGDVFADTAFDDRRFHQ